MVVVLFPLPGAQRHSRTSISCGEVTSTLKWEGLQALSTSRQEQMMKYLVGEVSHFTGALSLAYYANLNMIEFAV